MLIDLLTCIVALRLERHEDWTLLAPLLIQRFYYRQMMYVVLFLALKEAVRGRPVGWRGVEPQFRRRLLRPWPTFEFDRLSLWTLRGCKGDRLGGPPDSAPSASTRCCCSWTYSTCDSGPLSSGTRIPFRLRGTSALPLPQIPLRSFLRNGRRRQLSRFHKSLRIR